jgi:hypothetical protein
MDQVQEETEKPSMLDRLETKEDWDSLSEEEWSYLIWQQDFSDVEIEALFDELDEWRLN